MQRLCRLAVIFRQRPSEVARWPDWERELVEHYLARNPAPEERLEFAIAHLSSIYVAAHQRRDATAPKLSDFLLFKDAFQSAPRISMGRYTDTDQSILEALGAMRR